MLLWLIVLSQLVVLSTGCGGGNKPSEWVYVKETDLCCAPESEGGCTAYFKNAYPEICEDTGKRNDKDLACCG